MNVSLFTDALRDLINYNPFSSQFTAVMNDFAESQFPTGPWLVLGWTAGQHCTVGSYQTGRS